MGKDEIEIELMDNADEYGPGEACDWGAPLVEIIAALQAKLDQVPEEYRAVAELKIWAHDWEGSAVTYVRPLTDDEKGERLAKIEAQRLNVGDRLPDEWIRNVRLNTELSRDEAIEFIRTDHRANRFHPDVYVKPRRVDSTSNDHRPLVSPPQ